MRSSHAVPYLTCKPLQRKAGGRHNSEQYIYVIEQAAFPYRKGKGVPRMLRRGIDARAPAVGLDAQQAFILKLPEPVNSLV